MFCALCAVPGELYAGGKQEQEEKPLEEAEQLIEERRYNEAITILTEVMKEEPEKFDEAEKLMKRVREARKEFNETYQQLIDILNVGEDEELDEEEAYEVIRKLEELDADPNEAAIAAFSQARRSIIFAVNDRKFQDIMEQASSQLAEQEYAEAIDTYLSGFSLHRELFVEEDYSEVVMSQVESQKSSIQETAEALKRQIEPLQGYSEELEQAVASENTEQLSEAYAQFAEEASSFFELWDGIVSTAIGIDNLRRNIQREDQSDIPYLSTLRVLTKGREKSELPVGIAGAAERPVGRGITALSSVFDSAMVETFEEAVTLYEEASFDESTAELETANLYAQEFQRLIELWNGHLDSLDGFDMERKIGPERVDIQREQLLSEAVRTASEDYRSLMDGFRVVEQQRETGLESEDFEVIGEARSRVREVLAGFEETQQRIAEFRERLRRQGETGVEVEKAREFLAALSQAYETRHEEATALRGRFAARIVRLRLDPQQERLRSAEENFSRARSYTNGIEETIGEEEEAIEVRYPGRALSLLSDVQTTLDEVEQEVSAILENAEEEPELLQELDPLAAQEERGRNLLEQIGELRERRAEVASRAQDLNRQADLALAEGDLRFEESQAQMNQNNFERARDKLEQAGNAYSESLNYREDPDVRERIDNAIPELADRILYNQNQQIVREVRELINRGKSLFFQEDFIQAEQVLLRAQSRWKVTHTEVDPEISIWLDRVQRALETTTGVKISETDPLYPDMMQVLNLARQDFQRGEELYNEGRTDAAMQAFGEAEQKIEYIKEPFPNNQAAGVLYLRILRYTEPEDFDTIFSSRFRAARQKIETAPEEAYRELKVLEEIRSDYQGMDQAIYDAEIATGIRQPPPDPQKLARAREFYRQAQQIVEADVRARFPVAITYLNEAIKLNPDFEDAILLKDRLRAGQGGQVNVVLSSVDQQKLRRAENLFIDSRYYEASAIVDQLLQDSENRKNPKLLELKRRIESKL